MIKPDPLEIANALKLAGVQSADSDVRLTKIAMLKQSITTGTYRVGSAEIADKLIEAMK